MDWTGILIGLIGGFVLSIIANFFTEPIKNWLSKRSVVSRSKRVSQLKNQQKRMTFFHENKEHFFYYIIGESLAVIVIFLCSIFAAIIFSILININDFNFSKISGDPDSLLLFLSIMIIAAISILLLITSMSGFTALLDELKFLRSFDKNIKELNTKIQELTSTNQK